MYAAQEGCVRSGKRATRMVGEGKLGYGSSRLDRLFPGTQSVEAHEQRRSNFAVSAVFTSTTFWWHFKLDFDTLERQFQKGIMDNADFTICGLRVRQYFVHNQWGEIRLDQHDDALAIESLQCPSSARDEQALTPWEVSGLR